MAAEVATQGIQLSRYLFQMDSNFGRAGFPDHIDGMLIPKWVC